MPDDTPPIDQSAGWITDEMRARRKAAAAPYVDDRGRPLTLEALYETGKIRIEPSAERVLLRAILHVDASDLGAGVEYDARAAVAHEVLDVSESATVWERARNVPEDKLLRAGKHVFVSSACADRLSKMDKSCRIWTAHVADVIDRWDPPKV